MSKDVINVPRRTFLGTSAAVLSGAVISRRASATTNSPNRYVFSSLPQQMASFPFEQLDTISPRPLLVIAGSKADTLF